MLERLILGTVQLGMPYGINNQTGAPSDEAAFSILRSAFQSGIRSLDTADAYGKSQEIIGKYLIRHPKEKFKIYTKFKADAEALSEQYNRSVKDLSVKCIDGYSYHRLEDVALPHLKEQLLKMKQEGLISKIGVSIYTVEELDRAASLDHIDFIQTPFNLLDHWGARGAGIRKAKREGKEVHVRSVFLQGLFYKNPHELSDKLRPLAPELLQIQNIAKEAGVNIGALALQYALSFSEIDRILIGVETYEQLLKNIEFVKTWIPEKMFTAVSSIQINDSGLLDPRSWK
jgi:aryl-alcohol dehydrogenase-like predicted oxidoreductase